MVSIPIPDKQSNIRYGDISWHEYNMGTMVDRLTRGRVPASHRAHLDPDINPGSLKRCAYWRPVLGQTGAAQGHLRKNQVQAGDVFVFFGLFQRVILDADGPTWDTAAPRCHVIWGWLQIDTIVKVDDCDRSAYVWAQYHPHFHRSPDKSNSLYIATDQLLLGRSRSIPGAGVFPSYTNALMLTDLASSRPSRWRLPPWCYPRHGNFPLTYHSTLSRWQQTSNGTLLDAVARGQEFVLDTSDFPEAIDWLTQLIISNCANSY